MVIFTKLIESIKEMAKRRKSTGKSARRGNAISPYQKYDKRPFRYSGEYYSWLHTTKGRTTKSNKYATQAESERRA